jgi:N6-L-threonylcarbamoyladenine synthase
MLKVQELQKKTGGQLPLQVVADMAASFQAFVVEEVVRKSIAACRCLRIPRLVVGGGVIANCSLRERLSQVCQEHQISMAIPPMGLCTDNGAMVAGLGYHLRPSGSVELAAVPDLAVELN